MGIEALTHNDDGIQVIPDSSDDWDQWVSAGRTRNWLMGDPLIDWLQQHGKSQGYKPKHDMPDYEERLDFVQFIFQKGNEFETGILKLLKGLYEVVTIAECYKEIRWLSRAKETFEAMRQGAPIIYQGVLRDAQNMTYGSPDFLIRSDVLRELFPKSISDHEASLGARDLQAPWHYIVVDTKFTTIHLNASGAEVANDGSAAAYKAQMYIYNRALGRLQGYLPEKSYLLGRGWQQGEGRKALRCANALDRLGPIPQNGTIANRVPIADAVEQAVDWVRRVRTEGKDWRLLPTPSVPELYPNMSNVDDGDMMMPGYSDAGDEQAESPEQWVGVKRQLAANLKELTLLWQVGAKKRDAAHDEGIYRWDDRRLTPADVGINGMKTANTLAKLLEVNTDGLYPPVRPTRISNTRESWHTPAVVEFYVDFEFCSDLNDNFCNLPEKGGQPLIFMIGCGHMENGEWRFKSLVVDDLTEDEELRIIREWDAHMRAVGERLDPGGKPRVFHWSQAEVIALETAYNSARVRHGSRADWPSDLGWHDFLKSMREEPIVTRGAMNFGLKTVAKAMREQGLIQTDWGDSQVDGLGAMVGAWRCQEEARSKGVSMKRLPLMQEIAAYNEIDCKAMMDIIRYLRDNH